jgi:hypothetical protein
MNLNAMAAMPMFDSIRSLRSMSHTNSNAQYAKTVCARSIKQPQQSLKQKASIAQTNRNADVTSHYADKLDGVGTLTGLEQPNCSARTVKRLVRAVAIVIGISLFLPMASAVPATIDPKQSAKEFARSMISSNKEWGCLARLYGKESAWNYKAKNGSHYGIPQGRSKYLKTATAQEQVIWGLNYINHRYEGKPCNAWKHWQQRNWH